LLHRVNILLGVFVNVSDSFIQEDCFFGPDCINCRRPLAEITACRLNDVKRCGRKPAHPSD